MGTSIVVVENDDDRVVEAESLGLLVVRGDATLDETLTKAGVARAARLVSLLPRDSDNTYVSLMAREINPSLYIVSRAQDDVGETRLKRAGVDKLISTYRLAARKLSGASRRSAFQARRQYAASRSKTSPCARPRRWVLRPSCRQRDTLR